MKYYFAVLRKYAVFNGRARRKEFWYFMLFSFIITMVLQMIGIILKLPAIGHNPNDCLRVLYGVAILIPILALWARRMHDVNKSGWFALIPIYNLILACEEGTHGTNKYGANPKGDYYD